MSKDVLEKIAELITAAFGLVAALAWNEAIQGWFASQEALAAGGPWFYAIAVTALAVGAAVWIGKMVAKAG